MQAVDKENFEQEVTQSDLPVVVDLWGPQCQPCLALLPEVEELAKTYEGKVKFVKLNAAENRRLCMSLKVMGLPTFLFFDKGVEKNRLSSDDVSIEGIRMHADALLA